MLLVYLRGQLDVHLPDPPATLLVAGPDPPHGGAHALNIGPRPLQAEQQAGAQAVPHGRGEHLRGVGPRSTSHRLGLIHHEVIDALEAEVHPEGESLLPDHVDLETHLFGHLNLPEDGLYPNK